MAIPERTLRITGASVLALSFVGVAYVLSGPALPWQKTVSAESTEELLAAYAAKDTDGDSLPDWQEALYDTDPNKADTDGDGVSDGEAARRGLLVPNALASQLPEEQEDELTNEDLLAEIPGVDPAPGSITDQFSKAFLERYVDASNGQPMTEEAQQALVGSLFADFTAKASKALVSNYTIVSVHTSASASVLSYAGDVEQILISNEVPEGAGDPILLMQALLEQGDESARTKLTNLAASYKAIKDQLLGVSVPPSLADEHILLIRSFDSLARATKMVTTYEKDPLGVLGALSIYQPSNRGIVDSLRGMAVAILSEGEPAAGTPGAYIVNAVRFSEAP